MRFLIDRCAGRRLADWLRGDGHDVEEAADQGPDPGDGVILARAGAASRILITLDTDFGHLVYVDASPHAGLVRLPDVPAAERIELMRAVLSRHADALATGSIVTVGRGTIRISRR